MSHLGTFKEPCEWLVVPIAHSSILALIMQCLLQGTLWMASSSYFTESNSHISDHSGLQITVWMASSFYCTQSNFPHI